MTEKNLEKEQPGEWLLLFNDEVVDHSQNIEDILKLCEDKFSPDKFPNDEIKISKVIDGAFRGI